MSLLEDLFLQDEAGEAQELERVLEGGGDDEYGERPVSPTSDNDEEKEDEAEEDKRRVDPNQGKVKRVVKNPRFVLNPARLTGPRGIQVLPDHFKEFTFKGKGHEKEDLDMVLKKLEHWAYRLYPKFEFNDCLKKIETLGKKKAVMVHLHKIRSDQFMSEETVVQKDSSDEETGPPEEDEFDKLLQQQIELARSTPAPGSVKKPAFSTPSIDRSHMMPKATSSPSISEEQRERMLRNRRMAEERRLAKLRNDNSNVDLTNISGNMTDVVIRKNNRSNVIDSSDDEDVSVIKESVNTDIVSDKSRDAESNVPIIDITESNGVVTSNTNTSIRKNNRSNVIDSSDEDDVTVANESITIDVDVHTRGKGVLDNTETVETIDSSKGIEEMDVADTKSTGNEFDSIITVPDTGKDGIETRLTDDNQTDIVNDQVDDTSNKRKSNEDKNTQESNDVQEITVTNDETNTKSSDRYIFISKDDEGSLDSNKENVKSNSTEIMDIDFDDDF